jgi:hypothetical protein
MTMWQLTVDVPPKMWTGRGCKRKQRDLGLPALHNQRGVWTVARIVAEHHRLFSAALAARGGELLPPVLDSERCYDVLMVRVSRRPLDYDVSNRLSKAQFRAIGGDNASSAMKAFRDGIASKQLLDCDNGDRDPRVRWAVGQRWGPPSYVGVQVYLATWATNWWELQDRFLRGEL